MTQQIQHNLLGDARFGQLRTERVAQIVQPAVDPRRTAHGFPPPLQAPHGAAGSTGLRRFDAGKTYQSGLIGPSQPAYLDA
jgi:hypothetical protein